MRCCPHRLPSPALFFLFFVFSLFLLVYLPPGADDFTPLLIFVVIKAQANHLSSNLAYIERYHMASRLVSEAQYYFTQLVSWGRGEVTVVFCGCV
jgi:hypothetical protein